MGQHINPQIKRIPFGTRRNKSQEILLIAILRSQNNLSGGKSIT
ncbi:hypothetical protein GJS26_00993 [Pectobacterium carotovorum subsp. carotovorum]|nr:hypothetical protein [Pectobacterium carotovorum subsp. carotovorum]